MRQQNKLKKSYKMQKKIKITVEDLTAQIKADLSNTILNNPLYDGYDLSINDEFIGGRPKGGRG